VKRLLDGGEGVGGSEQAGDIGFAKVEASRVVVPAVSPFLSGQRKPSRPRTQGGHAPGSAGPTEDAGMRWFAGGQADNATCGRNHLVADDDPVALDPNDRRPRNLVVPAVRTQAKMLDKP